MIVAARTAILATRSGSFRQPGAGWPFFTALLACFVLVVTDLGAEPISSPGNAPTELPAAPGPDYRLGPEDVVEIAVWKEDGLRKEVLVRPDGMLSFPLVGEVLAAGRTATEIQAEVGLRLRKFLTNPVVSVTVIRVAAQKIYVIGRVAKPGEFSSGRYIDVLQALSMAGGLTPFASPNDIRIMRRVDGRQTAIPFRYDEVVRGRNVEQNIVLKAGDVVVVP
jgi:polysaccharide export outer membrane protein